eukprot:scaffold38787_cov73-Cyclotella_meneghiniana.AAC.1
MKEQPCFLPALNVDHTILSTIPRALNNTHTIHQKVGMAASIARSPIASHRIREDDIEIRD